MNTGKRFAWFDEHAFACLPTGILKNICSSDLAIQSEIISTNFHCSKCGKFKKKNTNSIYCFKCLGI